MTAEDGLAQWAVVIRRGNAIHAAIEGRAKKRFAAS